MAGTAEANKVLYGMSKCYIAKLTETDGEITYDTPFEMPGVVGLSPEPQGETTKHEGELVITLTPEEFFTKILGQEKDTNGAIIENANDKTARFALMFEGQGDKTARRWVYWDCTATRPTREHNTTEESIEVATESITITMSPRSTDNAIKCHIEPTEENKAIYDKFFTKVYEKDAEAGV